MHTNYFIFYVNLLWYDLNTDSEKLYISREPPVVAFTPLKPLPFLLRKYFRSLKPNKLKAYIYLKYC